MIPDNVTVRFRFKDQRKVYRAVMDRIQFENLHALPSITLCEIVNEMGKPMEKEVEMKLKKRLANVFKNDKSHVKNISYD